MEPLELTQQEYEKIHKLCWEHTEWIIEDLADSICEDTFVGYGMCIQLARIAFKFENDKEYVEHMLEWQKGKYHTFY